MKIILRIQRCTVSLQSWVNIGLETVDIDTKYGYSRDNYLAAFKCFKLVLERATFKECIK